MEEKEIKKLVEYLIDTQDFFLERNKETGYDEVEAEPLEDLIYHFFLSR